MRVLGHPLHPMLVHFPIALWSVTTLCDGLTLAGIGAAWPIAWLAVAAGTLTALPVAAVGLLDYAELAEAAVPTGMRHMMLMASALCAYAGALATRTQSWGPSPTPGALTLALSALGFVLLAAGGHFGAALVYRHGAGRVETR